MSTALICVGLMNFAGAAVSLSEKHSLHKAIGVVQIFIGIWAVVVATNIN